MGIGSRLAGAFASLFGRATTAQVVDAGSVNYSATYSTRSDVHGMFDRAFSIVGIAAKFNAQGCADVPVRLYRRGKGGMERSRRDWLRSARPNAGPGVRAAMYAQHAEEFVEVKDHPVLDLLANPNGNETGTEYARRHYFHLEICGNAFHALDVGERMGEPVAMNLLMPQWVRAVPAAKGTGELVGGWEYGRNAGARVKFSPEEVMQCRMFTSPSDPVWGVGPLHDVWKEFDLLAYALQFETALMQNESRPSYVMEFGPTVTADQAKAAVASFEGKHRGAAKSGGIIGSIRDGVLKPLGLSAKEMQYREGQAVVEKRILKSFGVPEELLARNSGSITIGGGSAALAAKSVWLSLTVLPRVNAWADSLNTHMLPRFGVKPGEMWFAADNPDGEDEARVADVAVKLVGGGIQTLNEARTELGHEPYPPEVGDVARFNGVSLAALDTRASTPPPVFGAEPPAPRKITVKREAPPLPEKEGPKDPVDSAAMEKATKKWMDKSVATVAGAVMPNGSISITLDPIATSFEAMVQPTIMQYYGKGWDGAAVVMNKLKAGAVPGFGVVNEWAVKYAMETKTVLSQSVSETLIAAGRKAALDTLKETIAAGIQQGMPLPELQAAVKAKLGVVSDAQAATIAITESHKAYQHGTQAGWKEAGLVKSRRWSLSVDPCVKCVEQAELSRKGVPMGQPYEFGGMVPAELHPNCRCTEVVAEYFDGAANLAKQMQEGEKWE